MPPPHLGFALRYQRHAVHVRGQALQFSLLVNHHFRTPSDRQAHAAHVLKLLAQWLTEVRHLHALLCKHAQPWPLEDGAWRFSHPAIQHEEELRAFFLTLLLRLQTGLDALVTAEHPDTLYGCLQTIMDFPPQRRAP